MWSESLKIRLSMTAAWLTLAACLLLVARLTAPIPGSVSSVPPAASSEAPMAVRVVDHSTASTANDAG